MLKQYGQINVPGLESPAVIDQPALPPLALPSLIFRTEIYNDRETHDAINLPTLGQVEKMDLLAKTIVGFLKEAHKGRIPAIRKDGQLRVIAHWDDLHHIVHQEFFRREQADEIIKSMFPFSPELDFIFEDFSDLSLFKNSIINLIPLDWTSHHSRIHKQSQPIKEVLTVFGIFSLLEILFSFVIFNIADRIEQLSHFYDLTYGRERKGISAEIYRDCENIKKAAQVLQEQRPDLYQVWYYYVIECTKQIEI